MKKKTMETGRCQRMRTLPNDTESFSNGMNFHDVLLSVTFLFEIFMHDFALFLHREKNERIDPKENEE